MTILILNIAKSESRLANVDFCNYFKNETHSKLCDVKSRDRKASGCIDFVVNRSRRVLPRFVDPREIASWFASVRVMSVDTTAGYIAEVS